MTKLENTKPTTKLRASSHKLGAVLGKKCNEITYIRPCKSCGNGEIEGEINSFFESRNYDALRKNTFKRIKEIEKIN